MKVEAAQGKQVVWNGLRQWGTLGLVARPWCSFHVSRGERILLRWDGNAQNSFLTKQRRIPHLDLRVGNGAPLDVAGTLVLPL